MSTPEQTKFSSTKAKRHTSDCRESAEFDCDNKVALFASEIQLMSDRSDRPNSPGKSDLRKQH